MRLFFYIMFGMLCMTSSIAQAEGLSANPWISRTTIADDTIAIVTRERQQPQPAADNLSSELTDLSATTGTIKDKILQKFDNTAPISTEDNSSDKVSTLEAINAANTLSKFMQQKNNSTPSAATPKIDFSNLMQKMRKNQNKTTSQPSAPKNNYSTQQLNKAKYQYNHYKSQVISNYNNLKNKTEPIYREISKGFKEVEKTTGIKF